MRDNRVPLKSGAAFGNYIIDKCIGAGGSGLIYTTKSSGGRSMVVKEFFPAYIAVRDPNTGTVIPIASLTALERFEKIRSSMEREVRLSGEAGDVTHFAVSAVHQECVYDQVGELIGVVYPKLSDDSVSLQSLIEEWSLNPPISEYDNYKDFARVKYSLTIINSALDTLDEIHQNNLLHCDISPSNLIWAGTVTNTRLQGSAAFLDFGSAVHTNREGIYIISQESDLPASTAGYGAPEVCGNLAYPIAAMPRVDTYAMGKVLCALVLENFEPRGRLDRTFDDIGCLGVPDYVRARLQEIVEKALQDEPGKRFQSATEMQAECQALLKKMEYSDLFQEQKNTVAVNRQTLWNAGRYWLESSKRHGSRFASLNVVETLMPLTDLRRNAIPPFPIQVTGGKSSTEDTSIPLMDAFKQTDNSLYLIGQGGIGKTTALIHIMNIAYEKEEYSNTAQIPLFIELSRAPIREGPLYSGSTSTFIRRTIYQQLRAEQNGNNAKAGTGELDEAFTLPVEEAVVPLNDLFQRDTQNPEYILLLDGLNEASRAEVDGYAVVSRLIQEIQWILQNCPNVRVVLTSRSDEEAVCYSELTKLYLSGVEDNEIRTYLHNVGMQKAQIDAALKNDCLAQTLKIPLYLTLYSMLRQTENVTSQGEIFTIFFSERQETLETYTLQNRLVETERSRMETSAANRQITALMQSFILDFVLPEMAWSMEKKNVFYLDVEDIAETIGAVLTDVSDTAVCGRYGKRLFQKYRQGSDASAHTQRTARDMLRLTNGDVDELTELIINCCIYSLGILQESNDQYGFMHHHMRDYFAAVKVIHSMNMAVFLKEQASEEALSCLTLLRDNLLPAEVRRFVGEALGEHHNAPYFDEGWHYNVPSAPGRRNLLMRTLTLYRGRFDGEDGYAIYNLMEILKTGRSDLSGEDFSQLDLTGCSLNKVRLGRTDLGASLRGAKITENTLFPMGHSDYVASSSVSPGGKQLVTVSLDGIVKLWDILTQRCVRTITIPSMNFSQLVIFRPDGKQVAIADFHKIVLWSLETDEYSMLFPAERRDLPQNRIYSISYNPSGKHIAVALYSQVVEIWDIAERRTIDCLSGHRDKVFSATYCPNRNQMLTVSADGTVKIWVHESEKFDCKNTITPPENLRAAAFSPTAAQVITVSYKEAPLWTEINALLHDGPRVVQMYGSTIIWDVDTLEVIGNIQDDGVIVAAEYCPRGGNIVTVSYNNQSGNYAVKMWDAQTRECIGLILESAEYISLLGFVSDCEIMVILDSKIKMHFIDTRTYCDIAKLNIQQFIGINSGVYSPNQRQVALASQDAEIKLWDLSSRCHVDTLEGHSGSVNSVSYSAKDNQLVSSSSDCTARIWNLNSRVCTRILTGHTKGLNSAMYNSEGTKIVTSSDDCTARVWNLYAKDHVAPPIRHWKEVKSSVFNKDGTTVITASSDGIIGFWETNTATQIDAIGVKSFCSAMISSDNSQIVGLTTDGDVIIWDVLTKAAWSLDEPDCVQCIALSPEGKQLAVGLTTGPINLWNIQKRKCIGVLQGHYGRVTSVSYGNKDVENGLISTSSDGTAIVWDLNAKAAKYTIHNIPGLIVHNADLRNLHPDSELTDKNKSLLREYGALL